MSKPIVDDKLWQVVEPLLPKARRRRRVHPGRKPITHRQALTGILFVLRTGIPWAALPLEMGCGSGVSCWRRLVAWQRAGVWTKLHQALLTHLQAAGQIEWSRTIVDSSSVRAMHGGKKQVPTQPTGAKPAANTISSRMLGASRSQRYSRRPMPMM
jgi:transposase